MEVAGCCPPRPNTFVHASHDHTCILLWKRVSQLQNRYRGAESRTMVWTVYRTTNLLSNKFYIGVHKSENPHDRYLGSGSLILRSIEKHGRVNFQKEILFSFGTAAEAFSKEEELVALELQNQNCYNMRKGGEGGFDYINRCGKSGQLLGSKLGVIALAKRLKSDPEFREKMRSHASNLCRVNHEKAIAAVRGTHLSEDRKRKLVEVNRGERNPMFGTVWLHHPDSREVRRVSRPEVLKFLDQGWLPGRTFKVKKVSHSTYGRIWINQKGVSRFIYPSQLPDFLLKGWKRGRVSGLPPRH